MTELLGAIQTLPILFVVFHKEKGVRPLFGTGYPKVDDESLLAEMKLQWKESVADKAAQISHVLCFAYQFVARPRQNLIWVTDQDSFCHTDSQVKLLQKLCAKISPGYAHFPLGSLSVFTTRGDVGLHREDGVALADLTAGATNEVLNAYSARGSLDFPRFYTLPARNVSWKAKKVINELFAPPQPCVLLSLLLYKGSIPGSRRSNVLQFPSLPRRRRPGIIVPCP
ncbi:MAG: hypothetical protein P4M07_11160 [Xanthobacteraceae bacterium]|nr:hypothetical protein [Xanthobacteraceae bacterium]